MKISFSFAGFIALATVSIASDNSQKIVFFSRDTGTSANENIYIMNIDGTNLANLSQINARDWKPKFTPDGKKIIFESNQDSHWQIYSMNTDGTNKLNLSNSIIDEHDPCISPDGVHIAFSSDSNGLYAISTMNINGSSKKQLDTISSPSELHAPKYSPDGSIIVYTKWNDTTVFLNGYPIKPFPSNYDIWIIDTNGNNRHALVSSTINENGPYFSPNGQSLAYYSSKGNILNIFKINIRTQIVYQLTNNMHMDYLPIFSPTGDRILFCSNIRDTNVIDIFSMDTLGNSKIDIISSDHADNMIRDISYDGKKILYESWENNCSDIYISDIDGTNKIKLTTGGKMNEEPFFQPISAMYVFRNGNVNISKINSVKSNYNVYTMDGKKVMNSYQYFSNAIFLIYDSNHKNKSYIKLNIRGSRQFKMP